MIKTYWIRVLSAVAMAAVVACGSDGVTNVQNLTVTSTFGAVGTDPGATDIASAVAGTAAGTVHVTGTMKLPAPCYDLSVRAVPSNIFISVEVTAERRTGSCFEVVSQVSYDVTVGGASAGAHTIAVRHTIESGLLTTFVDVAQSPVTVK